MTRPSGGRCPFDNANLICSHGDDVSEFGVLIDLDEIQRMLRRGGKD